MRGGQEILIITRNWIIQVICNPGRSLQGNIPDGQQAGIILQRNREIVDLVANGIFDDAVIDCRRFPQRLVKPEVIGHAPTAAAHSIANRNSR